MIVHRNVILQRTFCRYCYWITISVIGAFYQTQVIQVLEQVKTILTAVAVVVDVYLRVANLMCFWNVHVVVVELVVHHCFQIVVVSHAHRYSIRIGAAQVALGIVSHVVAVLIPVERIARRVVFYTVDVALGITLGIEEFPSAAGHLVGSRGYIRLTHGVEPSGQNEVGLFDIIHDRHTALELQVDIQNMALADRCYVSAAVSLLVVILIDYGDNLFIRQVVDITLATDIERRGFRR